MIKIPFVKNPGNQCMQANMIMALKHFYPERKFTFNQINKRMRCRKGKWTFPTQAAVVLKDLGLEVKAYSSVDIVQGKQKLKKFYREIFGKDYDTLIKDINIDVCDYFHRRAKTKKAFQVKKHAMADFEKYINKGYIVISCIDANVLYGQEGPFQGHFVTITMMDKNNIWINDPDRGPRVKYRRQLFNKAFKVKAIDDDVLVIFGKSDQRDKRILNN